MERVQFQQEQMLAELKDLVQKGLFTQQEIKHIMKRRTAFETALIRRIPKKADFLRYAAYEMSLEALRRKRVERLKIPKGPPTISDYALLRRQFQIFERALKKFKNDVSLWVQYIQAAQRAQARALVSRICGRALQLHPNEPTLYILAASHELKHLSHAAARVLLQRGIRLNTENVDLWREYVKMELGFVEALRRRWNVLGLKVGEDVGAKGVDGDVDMDAAQENEEASGTDNAFIAADNNDEQARKEILNGALVRAVISSAAKAFPTPELFTSLHSVLSTYPCPPPLRRSLLDHLHTLLHSTLLSAPKQEMSSSHAKYEATSKTQAQAAKLYASRYLTPGLEGETLVEALRQANECLIELVRARKDNIDIADAYAQFITQWFGKNVDEHLNMYLLASLHSLCTSNRCPPLYATHLRLIRSPDNPSPLPLEKLLKLARKYTSRCPTAIDVWINRLEIEHALETDGVEGADWQAAWEEARRKFINAGRLVQAGGSSEVDEIWLWGLEHRADRPLKEQKSELEILLREAQIDPSSSLAEKLLIRYVLLSYGQALTALRMADADQYKRGDLARNIAQLTSQYLLTESVWEAAFDIYSSPTSSTNNSHLRPDHSSGVDEEEEKHGALQTIYDTWRIISASAHAAAALKWGSWLLKRAKGGEAAKVIANTRTTLAADREAASRFDQRWRDIVDKLEGGSEDDVDGTRVREEIENSGEE